MSDAGLPSSSNSHRGGVIRRITRRGVWASPQWYFGSQLLAIAGTAFLALSRNGALWLILGITSYALLVAAVIANAALVRSYRRRGWVSLDTGWRADVAYRRTVGRWQRPDVDGHAVLAGRSRAVSHPSFLLGRSLAGRAVRRALESEAAPRVALDTGFDVSDQTYSLSILPMIQARGTGPQNRESEDCARLSPNTK
jgi:hypothetical protein